MVVSQRWEALPRVNSSCSLSSSVWAVSAQWLMAEQPCSPCPGSCWGGRGSSCLALPVLCEPLVPRRGDLSFVGLSPLLFRGSSGVSVCLAACYPTCLGCVWGWDGPSLPDPTRGTWCHSLRMTPGRETGAGSAG